MADNDKLKSVADKWREIARIGWEIKSKSNIIAKINRDRDMNRMSHRQMDILITLECLNINTISEMADYLKVSKSTLSLVMNKMVAKELIIKEYPGNTGDGRRVYFKISPLGHEIFAKMGGLYIEGLSEFYSRFNDEEKAFFQEGVAGMRKANNSGKTLFAIMTGHNMAGGKYSEELKQIARDIAYFFLNCRFNVPGSSKEIRVLGGITQNQFHLLLCVMSGMDTLSRLEEHLGASGSTLSIGISKLVENGFLRKEYPGSEQDGRVVFIKITDKGKEAVYAVNKIIDMHFTGYLSTLDDEKLALFDYGCNCLLKALNRFK